VTAFGVIAAALLTGLLLQRQRWAGERTARALNEYVILVALPCLILHELPGLQLNRDALLPIVIAWSVMILTALAVLLLQKPLGWSRPVTACLLLIMPLGNTGFVGFPLIKALLGDEGLPYAILYDQFGTFLALNTVGIAIAAGYSGERQSVFAIVKKIATFPPFLSLLLAFVLLPFTYPGWMQQALGVVAATLVPIVMLAVGINWRLRLQRHWWQPFVVGILLLLVVKPLIAWGLLLFTDAEHLVRQVIVLEAGMPAMISAGVLALRYNLAPQLAAALVGYSLLLSFASLLFWHWLV